jgi:hypothetical protein
MTDKNDHKQPPANERTKTDELDDAFRNGARIKPANGDPSRSEPTGLPLGMHDSDKSPVAPK